MPTSLRATPGPVTPIPNLPTNPQGVDKLSMEPVTGPDGKVFYRPVVEGSKNMSGVGSRLDSSYFKYMSNRGVHLNENIDWQRAEAQSAWRKLGNFTVNLLPNISSAFIDMIGQGINLATQWGTGRDYQNEMTRFADAIKNFGGATENYQHHPDQVFDPTSAGWWLNNADSLISSAAGFALGGGEVSAAFKGLELLGISARSAKLARLAAHGFSAATMAYAEGGMDARRVYDTVYNTQFAKYLEEGQSAAEAMQKARYDASQGAASSAQLNTMLNTALNITGLAPFFHGEAGVVRRAAQKEARILAGETEEQALNRIRSLDYNNTDLHKIMTRQGLYSTALEMGQESLEELNNNFASQTGTDLGTSGKHKGFLEQLGEVENWASRTMNAEGALSAALGAVGGGLQTVALDRIPFHKVAKYDTATNLPMTEKDENGNDRVIYQKLSSRSLDEMHHRQEFNSVRDMIATDLEWYIKKNNELKDAVKAGKSPADINKIRREILMPVNRRYVQMGMGSALVNTFDNIMKLDNTQPVDVANAEKLQKLKQSTDPADQQEAAQLERYMQDNQGKTEAMINGYTESMADNSYVEKAREAKEQLQTYDKFYKEAESKFGWMEGAEATDMVQYMATLKMNNHLQSKQLEETRQEITDLEKTVREQFASDPAAYGREGEELKIHAAAVEQIQKSNAMVTELSRDLNELRNAQLIHRNTGDTKAYGPLIGKYGLTTATTQEDIATQGNKLGADLTKQLKGHQEEAKRAEEEFLAVANYSAWKESNPGKGLENFITEWSNKLSKGVREGFQQLAAKKASYSYLKSIHEQATRHLKEMDKPANAGKLQQKMLKARAAEFREMEIDYASRAFQAAQENAQRTAFTTAQRKHHSAILERNTTQLNQAQIEYDSAEQQYKQLTAQLENEPEGVKKITLKIAVAQLEMQVKVLKENLQYLQDYQDYLTNVTIDLETQTQQEEENTTPDPTGNLKPEGEEIEEDQKTGEITTEVVEETEPLALEDRLVALFDQQLPIIQAFIDGMLVINNSMPLSQQTLDAFTGALNSRLMASRVFSAEETATIQEFIQNRFTALKGATDSMRMELLNAFLTTYNQEDAEFLTNQATLLRMGFTPEQIDVQGFRDRGLEHIIPMLARLNSSVVEVPAELLAMVDNSDDIRSNKETVLKYMQPHVAGAFLRSLDRRKFLDDYFNGRPLQIGLTGTIPAPGMHNYRIDPNGSLVIDGEGNYTIDPHGPYTMQVNSDGTVYLHEDLLMLENPMEKPTVTSTTPSISLVNEMINAADQQTTERLSRMMHDDHAKTVDAFGINTNTLDYKEIVNGATFERVSRSAYLDKRANKRVLLPEVLPVGTAVTLVVDDQYEGPQSFDNELSNTDKKVRFSDYTENGRIVMNEYHVGNVPIVIKDANTGEVYGYLPRADWVSAKYPSTDNYRNIAGEDSFIEHQRERIMKVRQRLADSWNRGARAGITTTVKQKNPGRVITNIKMVNNKPKVQWNPSIQMLPDSSLRIGIGVGTQVYVGKNVTFDTNNSKNADYSNTTLVLLPMADGSYSASPLWADKLSSERDVPALLYYIELFKRTQAGISRSDLELSHIEKLKSETGFDVTTAAGLRNLIRQFYTQVESFDATVTAIDAKDTPGMDRGQRFLFNITDSGSIICGTSYSGRPAVFADLTQGGRLPADFVDAFSTGIVNRPRSMAYADPVNGIRGINDHLSGIGTYGALTTLNVPHYSNGRLSFRKYDNYNHYVKSFTQTMVYGKHMVEGNYVYSANPRVTLDYTEEEPIYQPRPKPSENEVPLEDANVDQELEADINDLSSIGAEGLMGLFGINNSIVRTVEGMEATDENLKDLRSFTPGAQLSVASAKQALKEAGSGVLAPEHQPFIRCK